MARTSRTAEGSGARSAKLLAAFDALVIGAGFAGLYQLLCLRDRVGLAVAVLEQADGVGGS